MFFLNFRRPKGDYPQLTKATALPQSGSANTGTKTGIKQSYFYRGKIWLKLNLDTVDEYFEIF